MMYTVLYRCEQPITKNTHSDSSFYWIRIGSNNCSLTIIIVHLFHNIRWFLTLSSFIRNVCDVFCNWCMTVGPRSEQPTQLMKSTVTQQQRIVWIFSTWNLHKTNFECGFIHANTFRLIFDWTFRTLFKSTLIRILFAICCLCVNIFFMWLFRWEHFDEKVVYWNVKFNETKRQCVRLTICLCSDNE